MERLEALSLTAAEVAAELSLPPRAARAVRIAASDSPAPESPPCEPAVQGQVGPSVPALRRSLRRLAEEYSADTLAVRSRAARDHRRVEIDPCDDGMCCLTACLPLADGAMIDTRLQAIARAQAADDPRTTAQKRVDAFTGLLLAPVSGSGRAPMDAAERSGGIGEPRGGVRTEIVVTIPYRTLLPGAGPATPGSTTPGSPAAGLNLAEAPAEIQGYGRRQRPPRWPRERPRSLGVDEQAGAAERQGNLALRDTGCTFPGCDAPHPRTEADHIHEWSRGGSTGPDNLALLCPEHHRIKTLGHWRAEHDAAAGTTVWTSRLGRTHVTRGTPPAPPPRPPQPPPF